MKIVSCINLALCILFPLLQSAAQTHDLKFKQLSGANGVSIGKINSMTRDKNGVMWFIEQTHRCITRFDGNTVTRYQYEAKNPNAPGPSNAECIVADSAGYLWIGYIGAGIDRFDPETNTYIHYQHNLNDPGSLIDNNIVSAILIDHFGDLWAGTDNGLDRLDRKSGKFIHYQYHAADSSSLSHNHVRALYEDSEGTLWVGTGMAWSQHTEGGLNRFNREQNNFTRFLHDPTSPHSLVDNKVRSIFEDNQGNFWIGTRNNGIHLLDRKSGRIDRVGFNTDGTKGLIRPPATTPFDHITFITQDATGSLWFGTAEAGLIRYDPATKTSVLYGKNNTESGFTDNSGWSCYASPEGPMWVSTQQEANLFQVEFFTNTIPNYPVDISDPLNPFWSIHDITDDTDNIFWLGTSEGLVRKDLANSSIERFRHDPQNPESISDDVVSAIVKGSDGMIWLATQTGLNKLDPMTRKIERFLHDPKNIESISNNNVQSILEDVDHKLWIGTYGGGLNMFDMKTEKFTHYLHNPADTSSLSENLIAGVVKDDDGSLWISTYSTGLDRMNINSGKFKHYLQDKSVNNIFKDSKGLLWVCTATGIYCYNNEIDKFYQPEDLGTALKNVIVHAVVEDHKQNIWINTSAGVYRLNQKSRSLIMFGLESGINAEYLVGPMKVSKNGNLIVIGGFGYYLIDPNKLMIPRMVPKIYFKNLFVNGEATKVGSNEVLQQHLSNTKEIKLNHDQNAFSIVLSIIDYSILGTKSVYYKLEGYDRDWRQLRSEDQVYYYDVPPGRYQFTAKATNSSNGEWAEKNISFVISPPWWNTTWSYIMYGAAFAAGVYSVHRFQKDRLIKKERERARLRELEQAREIDKAKTAFFTNISHEFRTPLTLIKGPAQNLLAEFSNRPSVKKQVGLIQHNADLLLKLVNQLLDLAKLESGTVDVNATKVDLNGFLNIIIDSFSSHAIEKGIDLKYKLPDIRYEATFDKNKVEAIITNLLSNAVKFTPSKGRVDVNARVDVADARNIGQLIFTVADTGIGIPSRDQAKIFERFYQVNEGGAHKEVGTGIGLALVKELAELLKGSVTVKSETGKGSEFCVTIPLQLMGIADEVESLELQEIEEVLEAEEKKEGAGKTKLMIVEDNAELRSFIVSSLSGDYSFYEAGNGKEGMEIALQEIPELIISDVMMPEMDGITMTNKLKKDIRTSHIPIILLTAKATNEAKISGLNTGADDYLVKPFNNEELNVKVRNMIASRNRLREKVRLEFMSGTPTMEVVSADEKLLQKVQETILSRLSDEQLSVDSLAQEIGMSRAHFYRKITALTGLPVNELIASFRLERAAQLLSQKWGPVTQVAYEVGFSNPSYFSKRFKDKFGVTPSEYPNKDQAN